MNRLGYMHRDLKLDNILFRDQRYKMKRYIFYYSFHSLVIADLGLATKVSECTSIYNRCGSPGYIAPEILDAPNKNASYSEVCDIFSVGVIFYIL
jgi:serine/threonine protein kinase